MRAKPSVLCDPAQTASGPLPDGDVPEGNPHAVQAGGTATHVHVVHVRAGVGFVANRAQPLEMEAQGRFAEPGLKEGVKHFMLHDLQYLGMMRNAAPAVHGQTATAPGHHALQDRLAGGKHLTRGHVFQNNLPRGQHVGAGQCVPQPKVAVA